ncbi:putative transferase CAF17 homolog, mitochondrial [Halichondria panicea]|uniref:putative transferase CAF17 homolog, mitochondrial n=1 Tax=Halichondria panicea TaxID=6063 RepID=UPI00312B5C4A
MNISKRMFQFVVVNPFRRVRHNPCCTFVQTAHASTGGAKSLQLSHRSLVRVCGSDSGTFLQGLITADVSTLRDQHTLYSMILNAQGRVLYDIILYHRDDNDQLLECDSRAAADIMKHLKRYALRAKVEISSADADHKVWALFPGCHGDSSHSSDSVFPDPRLNEFGTRIVTDSSTELLNSKYGATGATIDEYHAHRLVTGLAEGVEEIPVARCFPLEYNLDLQRGVSFDKGCYVGQELTARTHHTGMVRKRVMPVSLGRSPKDKIPTGSTLVNDKGKALGKLICYRGNIGLALLRVKESSQENVFLKEPTDSEQLQVFPHKPNWWPSDLIL